MPSPADRDIANGLADRGISFDTIGLAFQLAFIRSRNAASDKPLLPIRSLACFRAVALNLTPEELDPENAGYVRTLCDRLPALQPGATPETYRNTRITRPVVAGNIPGRVTPDDSSPP